MNTVSHSLYWDKISDGNKIRARQYPKTAPCDAVSRKRHKTHHKTKILQARSWAGETTALPQGTCCTPVPHFTFDIFSHFIASSGSRPTHAQLFFPKNFEWFSDRYIGVPNIRNLISRYKSRHSQIRRLAAELK